MAQGFQCQELKAPSKGQAHALKVWCFMCLSQVQRPLRSRVLDDDHMLLALCSLGGPHSERRDGYPRGVCAAALPCSCSVHTKLSFGVASRKKGHSAVEVLPNEVIQKAGSGLCEQLVRLALHSTSTA